MIVAGFQGVSLHKEITTLGRGGSDTSAVALGVALNAAKVEFYKDVPAIFDRDPKKNQDAISHSRLSYSAALAIVNQGARILHGRAIELAEKNHLPLHVRSFLLAYRAHPGTLISDMDETDMNNSNSRCLSDSGCITELSLSCRSRVRLKAPNSSRSERSALCNGAIDQISSGNCCMNKSNHQRLKIPLYEIESDSKKM